MAGATVTKSRRTTTPPYSHVYLVNMATVADAQRQGIQLSLNSLQEDHMILLLSDSQTGIDTVRNLSQDKQPRSGIERDIKQSLNLRQDKGQDMASA